MGPAPVVGRPTDPVPRHEDASSQGPLSAGIEAADFSAIQSLLRCPIDGSRIVGKPSAQQLACDAGAHTFAADTGIPCLFAPNDWPADKRDVTEVVKAFYERTPFPNYDGMDSRDSLRRKAGESIFGRLLDDKIPHTAKVLEVGCGTGQMTNFLGMGRGRTAIGTDLCMNSLRLARDFRDRFSINNAHFLQANLFRPPFAPASFDVVISNGVLHHTSDCAGAFRSVARLVKPGGVIVIGLYNWLGRLPTLWLRALIERFGRGAAILDRRLRGAEATGRQEAWYMDQYQHPHETRHSMDEVLHWFEAEGFDFTASIPTIGDVEFDYQTSLFEPTSPGRRRDRWSSEMEMLLSGGTDGGLFVMIGRKRQ